MIVVYGIGLIPIVRSPETRSDGTDKAWKNPQSRSDRAPIEPRSRRDQAAITVFCWGIVSSRSTRDQRRNGTTIVADRDPIVARSWPDRGGNCGNLEAKFKPWSSPICRDIEATIHAHGIALTKPQPTLTTRSITHDLWPNFLFKTNVFLPFKLNF